MALMSKTSPFLRSCWYFLTRRFSRYSLRIMRANSTLLACPGRAARICALSGTPTRDEVAQQVQQLVPRRLVLVAEGNVVEKAPVVEMDVTCSAAVSVRCCSRSLTRHFPVDDDHGILEAAAP
jgi:hypothetical protein